jgi:ribosome biogenesis protein MAK21
MHSHPTVRLWAQSLMNGESIAYGGDPLLDFSVTNFLDRIAYKDPKSKEKLAKFTDKRATKMADYERPVNEYDFKRGEKPDIHRTEEEFMYKYLSQIDKRQKLEPTGSVEADSDAESDPELEAFANQEIQKEMKRLQGDQLADDDDEDVDVSYSDDGKASQSGKASDEEMASDDDSNADGQAGNFTESEEDFFSDQEELEAVNSEQEDEEEGEDLMEDMGSDYGQEYDEEVEEQEEADTKKKKKKVKGEMDGFASYEDFAHLLEEGAEDDAKKSKEKGFLKKRTYNEFEAAQLRFSKNKGKPSDVA